MATIEKLLCRGLAHGADPTRMLLPMGGSTPATREEWSDTYWASAILGPGEVFNPDNPKLTRAQRAILFLKAYPEIIQGQDLASLTHHLWRTVIDYDKRHKATHTHEQEAAIVRVALEEYRDPKTCRRCGSSKTPGKEATHVEGKGLVWQTCTVCEGKTWRAWSDNRRIRSVGTKNDRTDWSRRHAPTYERVLSTCTDLYRQSQAIFMARLYGPQADDSIERKLQARV